jgi:hypothetical protein
MVFQRTAGIYIGGSRENRLGIGKGGAGCRKIRFNSVQRTDACMYIVLMRNGGLSFVLLSSFRSMLNGRYRSLKSGRTF